MTYSVTYNTTTSIRTCYGSSPLSFYQMTQTASSFSVLYCSRPALGSNFTCSSLFTFANETSLEIKHESSYLVLVSFHQATPLMGIVRIYSASASVHTLNKNWNVVLPSTSLIIETNPMYLAIAASLNVSVYNISQNFTLVCGTVINGTALYSLKLTNYSFLVSYDAYVAQYSLFSGSKWTAVATTSASRIDIINSAGNLLVWK